MNDYSISVLNTPIKKIRNLTIHSPESTSPIRYPSMSDFPIDYDPINTSMVEKGYSQTLSNAVLRELDTRAKEISSNATSYSSARGSISSNRKRYSGIHRPLFSKMDSISSHYAATRQTEQAPQEISSSATKKRRTLNGPEDIFFSSQEDPSPTRRKAHVNQKPPSGTLTNTSGKNAGGLSNDMFAGRLQPLQLNVPITKNSSSPGKKGPVSPFVSSSSLRSSPIKTPGISPSKGSMDLHGILSDDSNFAKPEGPVRIRQSSLQLAGVKPPVTHIPSLSRKASSGELHKTISRSEMEKAPINEGLNKRPSTSNLRNKASMSSLQKKPSMNNLQKNSGIPTLQKRPSISSLHNIPKSTSTSSQLFNGTFSSSLKGTKSPSFSNIASSTGTKVEDTRTGTSSIPRLSSFCPPNRELSTSSKYQSPGKPQASMSRGKSNVTVPKPFSLYSKPTISSSQKSFGSQNSLHSAMSDTSLSASQRSLNRFQKFKSKFS